MDSAFLDRSSVSKLERCGVYSEVLSETNVESRDFDVAIGVLVTLVGLQQMAPIS